MAKYGHLSNISCSSHIISWPVQAVNTRLQGWQGCAAIDFTPSMTLPLLQFLAGNAVISRTRLYKTCPTIFIYSASCNKSCILI